VCACRPREVRIQCGHLFACAACTAVLTQCAICREPITAGYNITGRASDSSQDGYVSSGSNTYVNMEACHAAGCTQEATRSFICSVCHSSGNVSRFALCLVCVEWGGVLCPHCGGSAVADATEQGSTSPTSVASLCAGELCFANACGKSARLFFCCPACCGPGGETIPVGAGQGLKFH
jgi:hypothetical protein